MLNRTRVKYRALQKEDLFKKHLPQLALQSAHFTVHSICWFSSFIQLPLQLPAVGIGPCQLLLRLIKLTFQLTHPAVRLVSLQRTGSFRRHKKKKIQDQQGVTLRENVSIKTNENASEISITWFLYCSTLRLSSSTCSMNSFNFFSVRLTSLEDWWRSLKQQNAVTLRSVHKMAWIIQNLEWCHMIQQKPEEELIAHWQPIYHPQSVTQASIVPTPTLILSPAVLQAEQF